MESWGQALMTTTTFHPLFMPPCHQKEHICEYSQLEHYLVFLLIMFF